MKEDIQPGATSMVSRTEIYPSKLRADFFDKSYLLVNDHWVEITPEFLKKPRAKDGR